MADENEQYKKLLNLLLEAIKEDQELREKYQVGEKFRFIRDRLNTLKIQLEQSMLQLQEKKVEQKDVVATDEMIVYVYLYNAQGANMKTWQNMLNPAVFYEYSVNRPVYAEKSQIESYLRSKANRTQNGYLAVIVKKSDVIKSALPLKDAINNQLIKVKEGSLKFEKMISFNYNNQEYVLNEAGELIKKTFSQVP